MAKSMPKWRFREELQAQKAIVEVCGQIMKKQVKAFPKPTTAATRFMARHLVEMASRHRYRLACL